MSVPPIRVTFGDESRTLAISYMEQMLASGALTQGTFVAEFEHACRTRLGGQHAIAVNSGTSALEAALRTIGVDGKQVVLPANTFFATAEAIIHAGGIPLFLDSDSSGIGLDTDFLLAALKANPDIGAVIVVHIGGIISADIFDVCSICDKFDVPLIEDAAHAFGSSIDGRAAGTIGRLGCFSFFPTKVLTTGEGGLVTTQRDDDADFVALLRDHGKVNRSQNLHAELGNNWRLSEPHAAIGLAHLSEFDRQLEDRRRLAKVYDQALSNGHSARPMEVPDRVICNYYKYIVTISPLIDRARLKMRLKQNHAVSLAGEVYNITCAEQPYFLNRGIQPKIPRASSFCANHVCLPLFPGMTAQEQELVISSFLVEIARS